MEEQKTEKGSERHMYSASFKTDTPGLINYFFTIKRGETTFYYGNNLEKYGGEGDIYKEDPKLYQITVYKDFESPKWYKEGITYQIFVDRYCNGNKDGRLNNTKENSFIYGNWYDEPMYIKDSQGEIVRWDFFGGNLQGIINKLPEIKKLGVTAIYLNPVFEAASNHKYDAADYKKIDPMFGDEETFKELCQKALELGIHVILDGVFSHTGADSIYFNKYGNYPGLGAYQSKECPYYPWYKFKEHPDDYDSWWGFKNHPNVNELNEGYINFIIHDEDSVISKWMKLGAAGWRLDVADELPDEFIKAFKEKMKSLKEDSILIGEVWEDASKKVAYDVRRRYFFGEELDSVTNYPFKDSILGFLKGEIEAEEIIRRLMNLYENYPKEAFYSLMNVIGTHDTERALTALQKDGEDKAQGEKRLRLATTFQMTFPGVPLIYYGDEAGLMGGTDPKNRAAYPWGRENKEILGWYKKITSIRTSYEVFKKGDFKFYKVDKDVLCFERNFEDTTALVIINRDSQEKVIEIKTQDSKEGAETLKGKDVFRSLILEGEKLQTSEGFLKTSIKPLSAEIYVRE
ncbi:glycoside hydrolase family 13 protein [Clostridium polynesiense]|uniref:glycoside hydrolase family 13 protein n=1 Tax=Clostridium polynesiense TaxID=1325933 RepID=UPI000A8AD4F4|nr:glycoside hydrolase family 13 protein [Clostridium polynesiense]